MGYDPFHLGSGLVEGAVVITDCIFQTDPEYQNGQAIRAELTVKTDDGEETIKVGCGKDWISRDKGKTVEHETKPDSSFNKNSGMGMLVGGFKDTTGTVHEGLFGLMSDPKVEKELREKVKAVPLGPRDRDFWLGMRVNLIRAEHDFGGEIGAMDRVTIDGFEGYETSSGAVKAAGTAKKAPAAKKAGAKVAEEAGGLSDELIARLDAIADAAEDEDAFSETAFAEVPEATSDEAVKAAVLDRSPTSIWERAVDRYNTANPPE